MATMNISLPQEMKDWVEAQTKDGKYANSSDYVRDIIRRAIERDAKIAAINEKIAEGLASGVSEQSPKEIFAEIRAEFSDDEAA